MMNLTRPFSRLSTAFLTGMLLGLFVYTRFATAADEVVIEEPEISVVALFENAAMIKYKGKQKLYRKGATISPQIKLISANTRFAVFNIRGKRVELGLDKSDSYKTHVFTESEKKQSEQSGPKKTQIVRNIQGHYVTGGFINGVAVTFLVDTGATSIAMSEDYARLIGLAYKMKGRKSFASTANGTVATWNLTLDKVQIGELVVNNVKASVIKGAPMREILLGMSFLNRVKMDYEGPLLTLKAQY